MNRIMQYWALPHGLFGHIAGWEMALSNRKRSAWALEQLGEIEPVKILELGFGPGITIEQMSKRWNNAKITGIDPSKVMYRQASSRNRKLIKSNRLELVQNFAEKADFPPDSFDLIISINSIMFWKDAESTLKKIKAWLMKHGTLTVVQEPPLTREETIVKKTGDKLLALFNAAKFDSVNLLRMKESPGTCQVCIGVK